eukprot:TRINITY_DN4616_c1_g2_i1.p1 TRINITY_DN4616_c1_g2~~TRINITY_DN4616_c1_g2_i1.p1  ORF type:complete len:381 (+),score=64.10 TRINITY_DN4616_c1_g2_i1:55-1143(+)
MSHDSGDRFEVASVIEAKDYLDPIPGIQNLHRSLSHFKDPTLHFAQIVEKVEPTMLRKMTKSSATRVLAMSQNSLFLLDISGPPKRMLSIDKISNIITQDQERGGNIVKHVLIKVPTEYDMLVALVPDSRNADIDVVEKIRKIWQYHRWKTAGRIDDELPIEQLDPKGKSITSPKYAQLTDHSRVQEAKASCKVCRVKDQNLMVAKESMISVYRELLRATREAQKATALKSEVDELRTQVKKANAGRLLYLEKAKYLVGCIESLEEEIEDWRVLATELVEQRRILNTTGEDLKNLLSPARVAKLETRLKECRQYKKLYIEKVNETKRASSTASDSSSTDDDDNEFAEVEQTDDDSDEEDDGY